VPFSFADHTLDADRRELRRGPVLVPIEPQVFDLLTYLIRNRDRVVSKDDLIASVWGGRIVSESTLTSRINAARKAVGDNGNEQRVIRTVARKGFRFVSEVTESKQAPSAVNASDASSPGAAGRVEAITATGTGGSDQPDAAIAASRRASIAVMPFLDRSDVARVRGGVAKALAYDVITRLAKLRSLFVIAQGCLLFRSAASAPKRPAGS
jgi:DNA-binding winged helix-turn-helix (wHTH) protein